MRILTLLLIFTSVNSSGFEHFWPAFFVPNWLGSPTPLVDLEQEMDHWVMHAYSESSSTTTSTQAPTTSTINRIQSFRLERFWSEPLRDGPPGPVVCKLAPMRLAESVVGSMSPTIRGLVQEQCALDEKHTDSCPLIHYMDEYPRINGVHERLVLGRLIARQQFSTLFLAESSFGKYVIKYQCDCDDVTELHPLLRDYWFLRALNETDIAIKVHYLSPPVRWTGPLTAKTQFTMSDTEKRACMKKGSIRYLVMSQGVASMYQIVQKAYKGGPIGFVDSINVMELLIEKIQRMHGLGIIHGDIHPGNVLLMRKGNWEIGLIDFGSAMFVDELASEPAQIRSPGSYVHSLFSHWNVEGYRFSYRDDVFKALYVGAYLMNGDRFTDYVRTLERSATAMINFKKNCFMFTYPGGRDILSGIAVGDERRPEIFRHLDRALQIARSVDQIDDIPDYAGILTELGHASRIAIEL